MLTKLIMKAIKIGILATLALLIALALYFRSDIKPLLQQFIAVIAAHPVLGMLLVISVYSIATILLIPGMIITMSTGFAFAQVFSTPITMLAGVTSIWVGA